MWKEGDPARIELRNESLNENESIMAAVKKMPFSISNREFVSRLFWFKDDAGVFLVIVSDSGLKVDYGGSVGRKIRGKTTGKFSATNIESAGGVKSARSRSTSTLMPEVSYIPAWLVNSKIPSALSFVAQVADSFNHGEKIDRTALTFLTNTMKNEPQFYTEEEEEAIERGKVSERKAC